MRIDATNAAEYLRSRGYLAPREEAKAQILSGGVSNAVVHIAREYSEDLVLKQAREQLNVAEPWFCSVDRIWREIDVLRRCQSLVDARRSSPPLTIDVPRLLFEDRENHLYAMSAAPTNHVVWKNELLSGAVRTEVAVSCGALLGALHAGSWHDAEIERQLDDRQFFEDLRLDPYYRQTARVHLSLAAPIERLIDSVWSERHCLVHGDFSPKNLLVHDGHLMLIDFEVGHYGDPAFDLGFFLSHVTLKAFYHAPGDAPFLDLIDSFWDGYRAEVAGVISPHDLDALIQRAGLNLAGCALARLDGKSKIDYLDDGVRRDAVREFCRTVLVSQPKQWSDVRLLAAESLASVPNSIDSQTK